MSIAFNNIRTHKDYVLTNYGEKYEFTVMEIISNSEFLLKDIHTLDTYYMSDLLAAGKGKDYSVWER
ncbi:MAG: hypothetical protein JXR07_01755 [Reichenbachiella sp.]